MTDYEMYTKVSEFLQFLGCTIIAFDELPDDVSGRTYYNENKIGLNCSNATEALYTILHEGGHYMSYLRYFKKQGLGQPTVEIREKYAYLYGWYLIKILNLSITKEQWKENAE